MAGLCVNIRSMLINYWIRPSIWKRFKANLIYTTLILKTLGLASEQQWRWLAFALTSGQCWRTSELLIPSIYLKDKSKPKIYNLDSNNLRFSFWTAVTMAGLCVNIRSMLSNFWWERQIRKLILADNQGVRISTMRCLPTNKWQQHCYTVINKRNRFRKCDFMLIPSSKKWVNKLYLHAYYIIEQFFCFAFWNYL